MERTWKMKWTLVLYCALHSFGLPYIEGSLLGDANNKAHSPQAALTQTNKVLRLGFGLQTH